MQRYLFQFWDHFSPFFLHPLQKADIFPVRLDFFYSGYASTAQSTKHSFINSPREIGLMFFFMIWWDSSIPRSVKPGKRSLSFCSFFFLAKVQLSVPTLHRFLYFSNEELKNFKVFLTFNWALAERGLQSFTIMFTCASFLSEWASTCISG